MAKAGVVGASGYTGAELLRLCAQHPEIEVAVATGESQAGTAAAELYPSLAAAYPGLVFEALDTSRLDGLDLVFLALPYGASQRLVPELWGRVGAIVDLGPDFRFGDPAVYPRWYGSEHTASDLLGDFAYGLPELFRSELTAQAKTETTEGASRAVAVPGCYPTAAALALAPLVQAGAIESHGVIVDAASGLSGAGRGLRHTSHFSTANEDFCAYGLLNHRHTPEIEQASGAHVVFTPHLAPITRGILTTCYARPAGHNTGAAAASTAELIELLRARYADEPFVVVVDGSPSTKATWGSNCAHLTARFDARTGWVIVLCALDNLMKGAAGQAVQCANLLLGIDERTGLPTVGVYP